MTDSDNLIQIYLQEKKETLKALQVELEKITVQNYAASIPVFLNKLQLLRCNSHIVDFFQTEELCLAIEQILISAQNQNLVFSQNTIDFLNICVNQLAKSDEKAGKNEISLSNSEVDDFIKLCDRVSAGEFVEFNEQQNQENEIEEQEKLEFSVSLKKIDDILKNFDEIFSQQIRLKKQIENLATFSEFSENRDFAQYKKNLETNVFGLENLLKNMQNEIAEIRMQPISVVYNYLINEKQTLNDTKISYDFSDKTVLIDKDIIPNLKIILSQLVFNFIRLGFVNRSDAKITIQTKKDGNQIEMRLFGNGSRINLEKLRNKIKQFLPKLESEVDNFENETLLKYLFTVGFTGEKDGLDKVWTKCEKIKGHIRIEQADDNEKPVFVLNFPISLNSENGFFVRFGTTKFFIPSQFVIDSVLAKKDDLLLENQKVFINHRNEKIQVHNFASILNDSTNIQQQFSEKTLTVPILVVQYLEQTIGIQVDEILSFSSVVVKPLPEYFKDFDAVKGAIFDENNDIVPILYVPFLIRKFSMLRGYELKKTEVFSRKIVYTVLVADSSKFTRQVISSILASNGYFVLEAKDGIDALEILKKQKVDFVICAKEMPRMNGVILLENIIRNDDYKNIPVVLLPFQSLQSEKDSLLEKGAGAVIEKSKFDRNELLSIVKKFLY